ncbi:DUF6879 family protein [Actinomadura oligospora]|uniref:DUF6879 family protein n=1 Tax=Actinomadura oligospora TaxID=111804 RepID=UPI0004790DD4|nr:DUF6879 family protein [Actinomadura oligospora]
MVSSQNFEETFAAMLREADREALHLELRDFYGPPSRTFADWKAGVDYDPADRFASWVSLVREAVARGVAVRRARIVGTPVSEYTRYLHWTTSMNIGAGEQVRWLARRDAADLCLTGADFWLIDRSVVYWNHFSGDGVLGEVERDAREASAELARSAFEAAWARGVDHSEFKP